MITTLIAPCLGYWKNGQRVSCLIAVKIIWDDHYRSFTSLRCPECAEQVTAWQTFRNEQLNKRTHARSWYENRYPLTRVF